MFSVPLFTKNVKMFSVCEEYTTERNLLRAFYRGSFLSLLLFLRPMDRAKVVGKFIPHMNSSPSPLGAYNAYLSMSTTKKGHYYTTRYFSAQNYIPVEYEEWKDPWPEGEYVLVEEQHCHLAEEQHCHLASKEGSSAQSPPRRHFGPLLPFSLPKLGNIW
jgi:hypothetical protein